MTEACFHTVMTSDSMQVANNDIRRVNLLCCAIGNFTEAKEWESENTVTEIMLFLFN